MSSLIEVNEKVNESINEVMTMVYKDACGDLDSLKNMNPDGLRSLQACVKLVGAIQELQTETVKILDKMNKSIENIEKKVGKS